MQTDLGDGMVVDEEDQDSLFGSPPPTPTRGRSPSPALALPSTSSVTQNVGTIALPGSHLCSELPVDPLALSSRYAHCELPSRPPAQSQAAATQAQGLNLYLSQIPSSSSPCWSRAPSAGPSNRAKKKVSKKTRSKESTPRPGPEISLPNPSEPPPANFLRNQSALLGTAGLVGGVKPANLSVNRHTRGTNPTNPIVVEDEDETPILGRTSKFRHPYAYPIDPSLLPIPSTQEIVSTLIGQKDIFPVLESILRLIASGSGPNVQQFSTTVRRPVSSDTLPPPVKRRKLNRVPAGAVDWDVPYPFPQGEGPDAYRTTWERERGKQLISQLLGLIKNAARKAATKIYVRNQEAMLEAQRAAYARLQEIATLGYGEQRAHGHYRFSTVTTGSEGNGAALTTQALNQVAPADTNIDKIKPTMLSSPYHLTPSSVAANSGPQPLPSTPFDQLISSLLAASPNQMGPSTGVPEPSTNSNVNNTVSDSSTNISTEFASMETGDTVDQGLFNSWMNILQTFPVPSEGFTPVQDSLQPSTSTPIDSSSFDLFDFGEKFDFDLGTGSFVPHTDFQDSTTSSQQTNDVLSHNLTSNTVNLAQDSCVGSHQPNTDHLIDPTLLALSIPQPSHSSNLLQDFESLLTPSPIPSIGSSGDTGPATPNSAAWDITMPDIFVPTNGDRMSMEGGIIDEGHGHCGLEGQGDSDGYPMPGAQDKSEMMGSQGRDKGKGREIIELPNVATAAAQVMHNPHQTLGLNTSTSTPQTLPPKASLVGKAANKADILKRANERKKQLEEELKKAKTQLWETTIEQGVLVHLSKHYTHNLVPNAIH